jgi:hypothetical protein
MQAVAIKEDVLQYKNIAERNERDIVTAVGKSQQPYVAAAIRTKLGEVKDVLGYTQTAVQIVKERADEAAEAAMKESAAEADSKKAAAAAKEADAAGEVVYGIVGRLLGKLDSVEDPTIVQLRDEINEILAGPNNDSTSSSSTNSSSTNSDSNRSSVFSNNIPRGLPINVLESIPEFMKTFVDTQVVVYNDLEHPDDINQTFANIQTLMQALVSSTISKAPAEYSVAKLRDLDLPENYKTFIDENITTQADEQLLYIYLMYVYMIAIRDSVVKEDMIEADVDINTSVTNI